MMEFPASLGCWTSSTAKLEAPPSRCFEAGGNPAGLLMAEGTRKCWRLLKHGLAAATLFEAEDGGLDFIRHLIGACCVAERRHRIVFETQLKSASHEIAGHFLGHEESGVDAGGDAGSREKLPVTVIARR